ncbi:GtrA family protein [Natrinema pallidum]|uniref:GtrA family protein n=1 Tax=Natrinema pallidum TaxID=69527 RepID=A0A4P9TFH9_9EURY|nr:GtrA family protein [Natrinema pallidum]
MLQHHSDLLSGKRIMQFISIGAIGAVIETFFIALLTIGIMIRPLPAKAIGAEISISLMFILNDRFTFANQGSVSVRGFIRRWGRSHLVRLGGLTVAFSVLWVLTARTDIEFIINGADVWPTIANLIGIGISLVLNYVAESLFTWQIKAP